MNRLRIASVEGARKPGSQLRVTVMLERDGRELSARAEGVGTELVELRLAAEATMKAVEKMIGQPDHLRLVGVKLVHAFDADVVLVALRTSDSPSRQLVGAAPILEDGSRATAAATLDAVNRVLAPEFEDSGG